MSNIWLTPMLPNHCARIFVVFDIPTFVSQIVIYNYRKTPERGVRHLSVCSHFIKLLQKKTIKLLFNLGHLLSLI